MLRRAVLILLGIIPVFLVCEISARLFYTPMLHMAANIIYFPCFQKGTYYWFSVRPYCSGTNSMGLRGPEISKEKPAGTKRILVAGDSFAYGVGVDEADTFPRLLESSTSAEVVNAGVIATEPGYYYLYLKNDGMKLHPDTVIVAFYPENDVFDFDNRFDVQWRGEDAKGLPKKIVSDSSYVDASGYLLPNAFSLLQNPLVQKSYFLSYVTEKYIHVSKSSPQMNRVCLYKPRCRDLDAYKKNVKELFLGMKILTEEKGAKLLVVLIPSKFQIYPQTRFQFAILLPLSPDELEYPQKEFDAFFQENHIAYLDLLPVFQAHASEQTYLPTDTHWNALGHTIAASAISEKIASLQTEPE